MELASHTMDGAKLLINSLTLRHGYMTSITEMVGAITLTIERLRDNWAQLMWEASDERRELVSHQLALHKKAMEEGTKSPYFD